MPMEDRHNSQLSGGSVIQNLAYGLEDHTSDCFVDNCADLPWAWVLAILCRLYKIIEYMWLH